MSGVRNKGKAPRFYRSGKSAAAYVAEITRLLTEFGSRSFMVENENGVPIAVAFQLGGLAYRIRPDVEAMAGRLKAIHASKPDAVAWAQARHLLELQLEAIETGAAKASEVLGGYVLTAAGRTVGDMIEDRADEFMPGERLLLPGGSS